MCIRDRLCSPTRQSYLFGNQWVWPCRDLAWTLWDRTYWYYIQWELEALHLHCSGIWIQRKSHRIHLDNRYNWSNEAILSFQVEVTRRKHPSWWDNTSSSLHTRWIHIQSSQWRYWFEWSRVLDPLSCGCVDNLSLIHIWRCRRYSLCRSRWSPYH